MLFNSLDFAIFLPVVFFLYWFVANKNLGLQNIFLLAASYFFYACWNWKFLFLLLFSTCLDYAAALVIEQCTDRQKKKALLWTSAGINLGLLAVFKYYNFFASSFNEVIAGLGFRVSTHTLDIVLPIGISFYTFHGLSYIIDVYKNRIRPERNFINYAVFVSFFPLLVAGPIERATHLLPQIQQKRIFDYESAADGVRQILWGLFKKIVIADQCSGFVTMVFDPAAHYSGSTHLVAIVVFAFQVYCDFSGYADIASGTARLFGIRILRNFAYPFFSRSVGEFWRRWHISLYTWFRDYLYIPLGSGKRGKWHTVRNTFILFLACGLWHGASWTFMAWGALNAVYFMPSLLLKTRRQRGIVAQGRTFPTLNEFLSLLMTFSLAAFAGIFFRAVSLTDAMHFIGTMFSASVFSLPLLPKQILLTLLLFVLVEWQGREQPYAIAGIKASIPRPVRWAAYYGMVTLILYFGGAEQQFIYFQF